MVAFPVELALGRLTPRDALTGLAVQAIWFLLAYLLFRLVWRSGVRRYAAVDA
jgi:ABC-2 type transport system permease protein